MTLEPSESVQAIPRLSPGDTLSPGAGPSREYRSAVAFTVGGLFTLVVLLLYSGILSTTPPIRGLVVLAGIVLGMLAMFVAAFGLATGRPWAVAVMTPMLLLMVIGGAIQLVWALSRGSIDIALGVVLGLWALRAPIRTPADDASGSRPWGAAGAVTFAAMLISAGWPLASSVLLQAGGPVIASRDDLVPSLVVTCEGSPGAAPTTVRVEYHWRWSRSEPWAAGTDTLAISWREMRDDGITGYDLRRPEGLERGVSEANVVYGTLRAIVFAVDLGTTRYTPGGVAIELAPTTAVPIDRGLVQISATYLHAPIDVYGPDSVATWRVQSLGGCEW